MIAPCVLDGRLMPRYEGGRPRGFLPVIIGVMLVFVAVGCTYKPAYIQGKATDVPQRWKVDKVEPARLSADQRTTFERYGPPTYVRFFREVDTRNPVYAWIYVGEGEAVEVIWFVDGRRLEEIAVDSDSSAFSSTTRRRTRIALLVGTGAAILPAVVLLANR
jgi:hypothetical protein